ncbi:MAG: DUF502 domain-containing protein [Planctomycetota bacterium]|nr:DUF502 domain-containing protein [Planctomycetota bacterium]
MSESKSIRNKSRPRPIRRAVLRGLGVVLPPLLTILLFIWAWTTIETRVLEPIEGAARWVLVEYVREIQDPADVPEIDRHKYEVTLDQKLVPESHVLSYNELRQETEPKANQLTANEFYDRYVELQYLRRTVVIPAFLAAFILVLYLLGKFLAAGFGSFLWATCEGVIQRVPLIRNVYSAVKQVTDFVFSEREIEFNRVVAIEYPRRGIWSIGFVTGESMREIRSAAKEPVLSILMPTSPMPATGFTITAPKSDTIDLDITIDQAIQFVVSCGVVVPPQQQGSDVAAAIASALNKRENLELSSSSQASSTSDNTLTTE